MSRCGKQNRKYADKKLTSRQWLMKILSNIEFLARQSLPIRRTEDSKDFNSTPLIRKVGILKKKADFLNLGRNSVLHQRINFFFNYVRRSY